MPTPISVSSLQFIGKLVSGAHSPVGGAVTDANYPGPGMPMDGQLLIDTVNSRIYVRVKGVWKYTQLA